MRKRYRRYSNWSPRWMWKPRDTAWLEAWEREMRERWWDDDGVDSNRPDDSDDASEDDARGL